MAMDIKSILDNVKDAGLGGKKKRPKHGMRHTSIDHLDDGSHVARMQPHEGEETNFSAKDHNELAKKIKDYLGDGATAPAAPATSPASMEPVEKV